MARRFSKEDDDDETWPWFAFDILESGSKGNATLIYDETTFFKSTWAFLWKSGQRRASIIWAKKEDIKGSFHHPRTHRPHQNFASLKMSFRFMPQKASSPAKRITPYPKKPFPWRFWDHCLFQTFRTMPPTRLVFWLNKGESLVYVTDTGYLSDENLSFDERGDLLHHRKQSRLQDASSFASARQFEASDSFRCWPSFQQRFRFYMADRSERIPKGSISLIFRKNATRLNALWHLRMAAFEKQGLFPERYHIVCAKQWEAVEGGDLWKSDPLRRPLKEAYWKAAEEEYLKRLSALCDKSAVEEVDDLSFRKSLGRWKTGSQRERRGQNPCKTQAKWFVCTLDLGKARTRFFALANEMMTMIERGGSSLTFVIGGSLGLQAKVRSRANASLSLSRLTFTHQMTRIILLEQIYRSFKILESRALSQITAWSIKP
jgi:23S rRNA (pseudouridine1915-N3)-methyltransferase